MITKDYKKLLRLIKKMDLDLNRNVFSLDFKIDKLEIVLVEEGRAFQSSGPQTEKHR
jgi:phage regulator Rha-like protein